VRAAQLGVVGEAETLQRFAAREGLLGRVAAVGHAITLNDVPEGYLTIGSALGRGKPRHLVMAPSNADGLINAVIELGFFQPVDARVETLLGEVAASMVTKPFSLEELAAKVNQMIMAPS
jgi:hypothetical protein